LRTDTAKGPKLTPVNKLGAREWLSIRELTAYASVSERTLRSWLHRPVDPLPAVQVGGKILVRRPQFDDWLDHHRMQQIDSIDFDGIVKEIVGER
jgi:excisionase family DNA binding protein